MHSVERAAIAIRRSGALRTATPVWNAVRPVYIRFLSRFGKRGLLRNMNGTDPILIAPELYNLLETYEPDVWRLIMAQVRPGDVVADVGASLGLYTVSMAKRVGPQGRVYAFEPDPQSFHWLRQNVELNQVTAWVSTYPDAVGDHEGSAAFAGGHITESHITLNASHASQVKLVTLNKLLADQHLDLLKIDVEGFEEFVLRGAGQLLNARTRAPRAIFIEVHPYAWPRFGVSSHSLLDFLRQQNYSVYNLAGQPVMQVDQYGEIVARREARN